MNALVVACHPDPDSFVYAVRETALEALASAGHDVQLRDLYEDDFDPTLSPEAHALHHAGPETKPGIAADAELLAWAEWMVFIYPTWWGGQPAMLKGWMDRVLVQGVAYDLPPGAARVRPRLRHVRRISVLTTHGSSKGVNTLQGEPGKRVLLRGFRSLCHPFATGRWVAMYGLDTSTADERAAFLTRVRRHCGR